jgi:hypothetical protein
LGKRFQRWTRCRVIQEFVHWIENRDVFFYVGLSLSTIWFPGIFLKYFGGHKKNKNFMRSISSQP